jgi:hypothetical protein
MSARQHYQFTIWCDEPSCPSIEQGWACITFGWMLFIVGAAVAGAAPHLWAARGSADVLAVVLFFAPWVTDKIRRPGDTP